MTLSRVPRPELTVALVVVLSLLVSATATAETDVHMTAEILAGLPGPALADADKESSVERHRQVASARWKAYEETFGGPLSTWSAVTVKPDGATGTIFYPFGGPDFVTVHRLYPMATRYVLVGLETGGPVPDIDAKDPEALAKMLGLFERGLSGFASRGFFGTRQMKKTFAKRRLVHGITGVLMLFAERERLHVQSVEPLRVSNDGNAEIHPGDRSDPEIWKSVRLVLTRESDGQQVTVDYLQINLADAHLRENTNHRKFITSVASGQVVLKAASHLLQQRGFHTVRDALLDGATTIWQDETGLDYGQLAERFDVRLFGSFRRANLLFERRTQIALRKAYRERTDIEPLPFTLGYRKAGGSCTQYAERRKAVID